MNECDHGLTGTNQETGEVQCYGCGAVGQIQVVWPAEPSQQERELMEAVRHARVLACVWLKRDKTFKSEFYYFQDLIKKIEARWADYDKALKSKP